MIDIKSFTNDFLEALNKSFDGRIFFVGLQGSYARGEATENSDVDFVVILDELSMSDVTTYNEMLNTLPHRDLLCGFLSGKKEILNWEPSDLFQFYYDTTVLYGSLDEVLMLVDMKAVDRAIKLGVCNIYHACIHNMLYEKSKEILIGLYKSACFVIQAIEFKRTGKYVKYQKELCEVVSNDEKVILNTYISLKNGETDEFTKLSEILFNWAQKSI